MTAAPPTRARLWVTRAAFTAAVLLYWFLFGAAAVVCAVLLCGISCVWMPTELNRHSLRIERDPDQ